VIGRVAIALDIDPHSSSIFFYLPNLSGQRSDVYHTSTHGVALVRIENACLKCAARCSLKNTGRKKSPSAHHRTTLFAISSQLKHLSTVGKNLLNGSMSSICPRNILNFSLLTNEICWQVWGTPANFNGFRVLALLLQRHRSMEVRQTLYYVQPSAALVNCIYIFSSSCHLTEFCHMQNSLCVHLRTITQVCRAIS